MKLKNKLGWAIAIIAVIIIVAFVSCENEYDDPWTNYDGSSIVCRRNGCGRTPVYSEWNRRFCSEHIGGMRKCRHPECSNQIPNDSTGNYCYIHD